MLMESPPSPEDIELAPHVHDRLSTGPKGPHHSNSGSAKDSAGHAHETSSAMETYSRSTSHASTVAGLATRDHDASSGVAEAAAPLQKQQHPQSRCRQSRAVTDSGGGAVNRRRGRNARPLPPFAKVPTTAAMGAAVAARAQKSVLNPSTALRAPSSTKPPQPVLPNSPATGNMTAFCSPTNVMPVSSSNNQTREGSSDSVMRDPRTPHFHGEGSSPVALPGARTSVEVDHPPLPTPLLSGNNNNSSSSTLTTNALRTRTGIDKKVAAASRALTREVPREDPLTQPLLPESIKTATPPAASVGSAAPGNSSSALNRFALPQLQTEEAGHSLGLLRVLPTPTSAETVRLGEALGSAGANTKKPEVGIAVTDAAQQQEQEQQPRSTVTAQPGRVDDDCSNTLGVVSFASVGDRRIYSLAHSPQTSGITCTLTNATPHKGTTAAVASAAAAAVDRAFTSTEPRMEPPHQLPDSLAHSGGGSALADGVPSDSPQYCFAGSAQSVPRSPATYCMSTSASAAASMAAIGITRSTPALCPLGAGQPRRRRMTVATRAEEEALLRQSIEAGEGAVVEPASRAAMLTCSSTAPSYVACMTSVTVSDGVGVSSMAGHSQSPGPQQQTNGPIDPLGAGAAQSQRINSVTNNVHWGLSSTDMKTFSNGSIAGAAGVAPILHERSVLGNSVNNNNNNSSVLLSGSLLTAGGASMRGSFNASIFTQQNKSALVSELKLRRQRLQKQLGVLQKEATARNIFALVRASNASQLQYLLQVGLCSVNDRDYNGCTPLHVAAGEGNQTIVHVLLSFGADVVAVDYSGRTPLDCAAANRHSGVAHYLLTVIRNKHFNNDSGAGGGATSSRGDDGPCASILGAEPTTEEGSVATEVYPSRSNSPAWGAAPLGVSPAEAPASSSTLWTATSTTQSSTPAQQHRELLESSPTLLLPLRRQHRQQQQQHWVSCSTVASTPSPSIPENFDPNPSMDAALGHTTDGANWSEGDTSPPVPGRGVDAVPAVTAAGDIAVAVSAPPSTTSKPLRSSLASGSICGPASRWMLPQSTGPQNSAPQEGSEATGKSRGANSSLTRHESFMPMSASRWRHNSIPHGSSPQRPVFLSSLDSTAAAHSRGLIAAESNAGSAPTVPFSACSSSSPSRPSTFVSGVRSPASQPMAPPPSAVSIGEPTTSFGNSSAGGDDDSHRRPVVSAPPYLAGGVEESVSYETRLSTTQRPSSRTSTAMSLTQTTATAAAATIEKWPHSGEESLADPDVDGIVHNPQGRPHPLQDEASTSFLGGFGSASSGFLWSNIPRSPTTRKDLRHNRKDRNNFKETGSFPGEMPTNLPTHPMRAAATSATTAAMFTSGTVATASGGSAQHRPMLLRSLKRPQNRFSATESRREALDAEKDVPPTRMLHPLMLLTGDTHDRSNGDRGGSDPVLTTTTLTRASTIGTTPVTPMVGGAHKSLEDLTGSMAGSGAGSLRDMGQQSLEEHHHHFRMTAGGMRINMRQSKVKFDLDRYSAPLAETRDVFEPTTTEAAVTRLSVPSGGSSERRSSTVTTDHHHHHVAQHASHPAAAALSTPWSTGATSDALAPANPANASRRPVNALGATPEKAEAPTTAERPPVEKQLCLGEVQDEPADLSALDHSSYTTVSDTVSMIVCMVGLPGRGKSFISKRLVRYMNWKGVPCKVFNAGNYRRHLLGVEETAGADFFDPNNPQGAQLRERMAELACEDLVKFIASYSLAVGILDATNTTRKRRAWLSDYFQREAQRHALPYRLLFIESVCTDDAIVMENILRSKCDNDDFKNVKDVGTVIAEFRNRILNYEKVYETLEPEERMPYIKIINIKHHVILHRVQNGLGSRIAFFLMNLHPIAFPIYVALPGETVGDSQHVYGGEERLTARGEAYAIALKNFIQDRYVPHMVVLHATNYCVLSTLAPLMDGAMEEEGAHFLQAVGNANGHGVSGGRALPTFKAPTHAPQQQAAATKSSATLVDQVGTTGREASMSQAPKKVLELPSSMYNVVPPPEGSEQDTLVPSADGPPCRLHPHSPAVSVTATPPDAASYHSTGSAVPDTNKAMNRDDVDHAEVPPAAQLRDSYDGGVTAVNGHSSSVAAAVAEFMRDDDSGEEEVADDVLCPVPGLDNINFGRFSGHTAAWVSKRYPRLSTLLYDMDDGDMAGDAKAEAAAATATAAAAADRQEQPESLETRSLADTTASLKLPRPVKATGSAPHNNPDPRNKTFPAVGQSSAPLPPPMHYATHEEAIAHLQRAPDGVDPRLAYGIPLPNGESFRQVNVRLEPALMAIMRSQSPVFVVAPAVPAQGVLSFFMDLIPELSPTIRIPKGCVVEVGVKDSITVHPLLPDALPEKMTRSPLTVLPEIQEAIREVGDLQLPGEQQGKYAR
ncbi:hypothetical protein JKF63_07766 [Porcisia hertigi]|uniref:6-phosphofructo-2-kinase domain-containing protein n=1 Tax=Porcisia hertigi TaxID=2761500 RepID=A0A836LLZ3_9TRYP|nr:hypothetical protein JKF63_07766 [Porcisia hertigi]